MSMHFSCHAALAVFSDSATSIPWSLSESKMDLLRRNFWLFLIIGMVLVCLIIGLIFLLINKCISKTAAIYKTNFQENSKPLFYTQNSQYHPKHLEEELPPLPPRNIVPPSRPESANYEDIPNVPDYIKVDEKTPTPPPPPPPYMQKETPLCTRMAQTNDTASMDSYDDVLTPAYESEDYDDIG
ncbi:SLP adapter and CSK-interacting membrane protein [Arapaima gigas]